MKSTVTNINLAKSKRALEIISTQKVDVPAEKVREEIKLAYNINKNIDAIARALRDYEFERGELLELCAEKDEKGEKKRDGDSIRLKEQMRKTYYEQSQEQNDREVEIEVRPFSVDEIADIMARYNVSGEILGVLHWMIADDGK
jgi:hypothetical protein